MAAKTKTTTTTTTTAKSKPGKGAGRPVGSTREATLARILPAARKLFADKGYAKTTFKDVGKAVGMTHAALYAYFPSKAELYQACCVHTQSLLLPDYVNAIETGGDLKTQLREILRASAAAHDRDDSITGLLGAIPLELHRHPELTTLMLSQQNDTFRLLAGAFARAQRRGEISDSSTPEDQVVAIMGAAVGVALFQFGLQRGKLVDSMDVLIDLVEARLFLA